MNATTEPASAATAENATSPAFENAAVARCCNASTDAHDAALAAGKNRISAGLDAAAAYRKTMPPLSGQDNIRDFVACIAHGMLIGILLGPDCARLLYAAQVAHSTLPSQSTRRNSRNSRNA